MLLLFYYHCHMEKTEKIKIIHKCTDKPTENWIYFYDLEMENWDRGSIGKKKLNAFNVWDNLTYTLEPWRFEWKFYLKEVRQNKQFWKSYNSETPQERFIWFAMAYAKDIAVATINSTWMFSNEALTQLANELYWWMNNKYLGLQNEKKQSEPKQEEKPEQNNQDNKTNDSNLISSKQITLIKTLWTKTRLDENNIRKWMKDKFWVESSKELNKDQASEFIDQLKKRSEEDEKTPSEEKFPWEE